MLRRCYAPNTQGDRKRRVVFVESIVIIENKDMKGGKKKTKGFSKQDSEKFETMSLRSTRSEKVLSTKKIG